MPTEFSVAKIDVGCGRKTKINHMGKKNVGNRLKKKSILREVSGQLFKKYDVGLAKFNVENIL